MKARLSTLFGVLVGTALATALLLPQADRGELVARAAQRLLAVHRTQHAAGQPNLFAALEQHLAGADDTTFRLEILVDGQVSADPRLQRAFGSELNSFNAGRGEDPQGAARPPLRPDAGATTALRLLLTTEGQQVSLGAELTSGERVVAIAPLPDDAGSTRMPDRTAIVPPLLAILVALVFRRVLVALFAGILAGAVLLAWQRGASWLDALGTGFVDVFAVYFHKELVDTFRVEIIGFVIALVAMVGVMSRSGGVRGLVELLLGFARSVRSTLLVTWGMGVLIFFDDYANCLLVGSTMRPLTDRHRISREKLAYIVDSTAAPIAGIMILSTWIAFEVSTYEAHLPAAGITENAYAIFLQTIPFRFYCLFTLAFVFLSILTGRDFGPMRRAELRARTTGELVRKGGTPMVSDEATRIEPREGMPSKWFYGGLPIALVLVMTIVRIFVDGGGPQLVAEQGLGALFVFQSITGVLYGGSGAGPIFLGASSGLCLAAFLAGSNRVRLALLGGLVAAWLLAPRLAAWPAGTDEAGALTTYAAFGLVLGATAGLLALALRPPTARPHLPFGDVTRASLASVRALFFAVVILFEAWMIGSVCADIQTADYLVALLSGAVSPVVLPVLLFVAACLVAFATGSSWSTMSILLPNVVALAAVVGESAGMGAVAMVVLCIGAVLEGSIFGDHCSPISDTTVLSSVSSASDHVDHVRTQAPYALTTATLAVGIGYIPTVYFGLWQSWSGRLGVLASGVVAVLAVLFLLGRKLPAGSHSEPPDALSAASTGRP